MKSFLFKCCFISLAVIGMLSQQAIANEGDYSPYPDPDSGYVSDFADLLSAAEETQLEELLLEVESKSGVEIAVVTINALSDYAGTENWTIESFATALFDSYGIGNMPKNDGVLLLISKNDRKARIELGQFYGQDRNKDVTRIMQYIIVPKFKLGDYPTGIVAGTEAIVEEFAEVKTGFPWQVVGTFAAALVSLTIGISCFKSGKRGWGYVFIGIAVILLLLALNLLKAWFNGSGRSSGGSSGGGFGGGSSGGGGATGSW